MAIPSDKDKPELCHVPIRDADRLVTRPIPRDDCELATNGYQPPKAGGTSPTTPPPKKP